MKEKGALNGGNNDKSNTQKEIKKFFEIYLKEMKENGALNGGNNDKSNYTKRNKKNF